MSSRAENLARIARAATPTLLGIFGALMLASPLRLFEGSVATPVIPLVVVYFWSLYSPGHLPAVSVIEAFRWQMLIANSTAVLLTGLLGYLTVRRIVRPIQALETSVKSIAAGDYGKTVPFTAAPDETGGLARSIDVLKAGAAEMDEMVLAANDHNVATGCLSLVSLCRMDMGASLAFLLNPGTVHSNLSLPENIQPG